MAYSEMEMNSLLGYLVNEYGEDIFKKKQKVRMKVYLDVTVYGKEVGTVYVKYIKYDIDEKVFKLRTSSGRKIKLPFTTNVISVEFDY